MIERPLKACEVADLLRKSERTVKRRRLAGMFPGCYFDGGEWLFPESSVEAHVAAMKATPLRRGPRRANGKFESARRAWLTDLKERIDAEYFPQYRRRKAGRA